MCGITGAVWNEARRAIGRETLLRMTSALRHRGPDDEGGHLEEIRLSRAEGTTVGVALGHRRLSIIDLGGGHQPMPNEDESVWVVFNGEIYNFASLRRRLEGGGHRFRSHSDTEVLVHLYEEMGPEFVTALNGMFAIAIWDARHGRLVLARDRLGQKPLVYRREPGRLLFASELKSLLELPDLPREVDPQALDLYLTYQYVPHPHTIYKGFSKLPPGHFGVWENGQWAVHRYWSPDFNRQVDRPAEQYREALRETLTSAVRLRLQSEVPLGAFLSGGVDSTIIVGLMQQAVRQPVKTFSIGFPIAEYDETSFARQAASHLGTEHHEFRVEPEALEILPQLVWQYDEPFADSSAIPTWYVSQQTRQHVTVALTGDAGDELFAGYPRYRAVRLAHWIDHLPLAAKRVLFGRWWQRLPASPRQKSFRRRLKRLVSALAMPPARRYLEWIAIFNESRRAELYEEEFVRRLDDRDPLEFLNAAFAAVRDRDPVSQVSLVDLMTYLPCDLMTKVDIASMAHSLECRQPFLDYRVVELAIGMPVALKMRGLRGKRILMETFAELIPPDIRRRPKMGFGVPLDHWFRHELRELTHDVLLAPETLQRGYFRPESLRRLVQEHVEGRFDHSYRLWALLFFELWHRRWIDR